MDKNVPPKVPTDKVFSEPLGDVTDFKFNKQVATVFDDMVSRSVPFYGETQRMITEIAADYATPGSRIYDLGCATGTTLEVLDPVIDPTVEFVGIDNAQEMLERCREKLVAAGMKRPLRLEVADLNEGCRIENASVVLLILTLQFLRPLNRERLMKDLLQGMNDNGCLILVEKVLGEDSLFNRQFIKYYYDLKRRNGYSDIEITQKREALENVLIPYKLLENRELLLRTGFRYVDVFFKWYNFCGIVAVK
ncbi:MAG: carboxy-S-adenosyl-L-methionine synthase CmoA [Betaproteobacteria bacterium]|nr:carboxy-S-adenosyl-L-methionine synthase CmoA [Betaproteobacteria bacterium]